MGPIPDVSDHNLGPKIEAVFANGLMLWPTHFCLKTFGRLLQLIFRFVTHRRKAEGRASTIAQL